MAIRFEWHLTNILRDTGSRPADSNEFALIILNQPLRAGQIFDSLWSNARVRVAADGGANRLYDMFQSTPSYLRDSAGGLDAIVGDLDSLRDSVKEYFTSSEKPAQVVCDPDQEFYDFDKAVSWVRSNYAHDINLVILGDLGGRVDHGLRQIHYLYLLQPGPAYDEGRVFLATSKNISILLKPGHHRIWVEQGDKDIVGRNVGVLPVGSPSLITTVGLEQDVQQQEVMLGQAIHRSQVLQGKSAVDIEISNTVLFTIDLVV